LKLLQTSGVDVRWTQIHYNQHTVGINEHN